MILFTNRKLHHRKYSEMAENGPKALQNVPNVKNVAEFSPLPGKAAVLPGKATTPPDKATTQPENKSVLIGGVN